MQRFIYFFFIIIFIATNSFAATVLNNSNQIEVAITFDDLPYQGAIEENEVISAQHAVSTAQNIISVLRKHNIPSTWGFLNAKAIDLNPEMIKVLKLWVDAGNKLGNHTYFHIDLAKVSAKAFISNIQQDESLINVLMKNKNYHFFRYPYLSYGETEEKYNTVRHYLTNAGYQIADVTMDFFDSEWSPAYQRCEKRNNKNALLWLQNSYLQQSQNAITIAHALSQQLFKRDIKYILLLHFSDIQSDVLDRLLTNYENHGVKFISLETALQDPIYQIDPKIYRERAYTLLNRIRLSRGLANPQIVSRLYATLPEDKLGSICR